MEAITVASTISQPRSSRMDLFRCLGSLGASSTTSLLLQKPAGTSKAWRAPAAAVPGESVEGTTITMCMPFAKEAVLLPSGTINTGNELLGAVLLILTGMGTAATPTSSKGGSGRAPLAVGPAGDTTLMVISS